MSAQQRYIDRIKDLKALPLAEQLVTICSEAIGMEVTLDTDLVSLGLSSIDMIPIQYDLAQIGFMVSPVDLIKYRSVRSLLESRHQ